MAKGLTEKQRKILEFIIDFQRDHGFPPTIRELGDAFEIGSLRGVTVHLDALVRKGYMTRERTSRSIRVTGTDPREAAPETPEVGIRLPLVRSLGSIPGVKVIADGQIERYLSLPDEIASRATEQGFVIRVGASGVHGEPIAPGDLLVVRPQQTAHPGDLVVMASEGDLVVRRATGSESTVSDGTLPGESELLGRVVGMLRRY